MKSNRSSSAAAVALVAMVAAVVLSLGFVGGHSDTQQAESHDYVAADHPLGVGVVVTKTQRGGFDFLGLTVRRPQHYVRVAFTVPGQCDISGVEDWPIADPDCAGPPGLAGSVAGNGLSVAGHVIVIIERRVEAECYADLDLGEIWPIPAATCRGQA